MGVDFIACETCGETFPDCGGYTSCQDCGVHLCTGCADERGLSHSLSMDGEEDSDVCPFCNGDEVTDENLLNFALEKLGMDRETLAAEWQEKTKL